MKANELRIGNWVEIDKKAKVIEALAKDHFTYDDIKFCHGQHVKPIPLTKEWLVKFGFKKEDDEMKLFYSKGAFNLLFVYLDDFSVGLYDNKNEEGNNYLTPNTSEANQVHQLQNLYYALTGEELVCS